MPSTAHRPHPTDWAAVDALGDAASAPTDDNPDFTEGVEGEDVFAAHGAEQLHAELKKRSSPQD